MIVFLQNHQESPPVWFQKEEITHDYNFVFCETKFKKLIIH